MHPPSLHLPSLRFIPSIIALVSGVEFRGFLLAGHSGVIRIDSTKPLKEKAVVEGINGRFTPLFTLLRQAFHVTAKYLQNTSLVYSYY